MGGAHEGSAAYRLLRERSARFHVRRSNGPVRRVLRNHGRTGLRVGECGRLVGSDCSRSAGSAVGRGANAAMIRVILPAHLRSLARVESEVKLEVEGQVTQRSVLYAL